MPTPLTREVWTVFYHAIGRVVVKYGFIDALIATTCRVLFEDLGGHSSQKKAPRPMGVRLEYIGKCFRNKPELADLKQMAENICATIQQLDFYRAYLVHGCMTEHFTHDSNPSFEFTKVDTKKDGDGYEQVAITVSLQELAYLAETSTQVINGLTTLGKCLDPIVLIRKGQQQL
jgi:hypothetical protein